MTRLTEADVQAHMDRMQSYQQPEETATPDDGPESKLQQKIVQYARHHGYPCLSFRQSRKAKGFLEPGWPDITMLLPEGRVLLLELKSGKGRMSEEQKQFQLHARFFKHEFYEVRSFKRFLGICKEAEK